MKRSRRWILWVVGFVVLVFLFLFAVAIPNYQGYVERARERARGEKPQPVTGTPGRAENRSPSP